MSAPPSASPGYQRGLAECLQVLLHRRRDDLVDAEIVGDAVDLPKSSLRASSP
jgi:hypothetical protein